MKTLRFIALLTVLSLPALAQAPAGEPLPTSGLDDSGRFKLIVRDSEVGVSDFTLRADGTYTRQFTMSMAGQKAEFGLDLACDGGGRWTALKVRLPGDAFEVVRKAGQAEFTVKGQPYRVPLGPDHLLFDNYGPALEAFMVRGYDRVRGGKQTFHRFIAPQAMVDTDLTLVRREIRRIGGADRTFLVFDQTLASMPLKLWAGEDGKIYLIDIPSQYASYVRQGFEELLQARSEDPLLSKPEFSFSRRTEMVPMRDGVRLATDLYLPEGAGDRVPVILIRTPYKKEMGELDGTYYARRGYAVAVQDCRGRFASEGAWTPFLNESKDGYDAVEWLAGRPWSSGKVGMIGGSYLGWVQLWAAVERPPHLATIVPNVAPPDPFFNIPYEYGSFFILGSFWWADILESGATGDLSGKAMERINGQKYERILKSLPVIDLDEKVLGKRNPYWRQWIEHNVNDDYWRPANFRDRLAGLDIPVFLQSGWYDGDGIGSKLNYLELRKSKNPFVKLIVGPWGHTDQASNRLGDLDFGPEALLDLRTLYLRWFDRWLKGVDNKVETEPLVKLFVMFRNQWLSGDRYPLPQTVFTKYYLSAGKGANTSRGDGSLGTALPAGLESDRFTYDPGDPTPAPDYYFKTEEQEKRDREKGIDTQEEKKRVQAFHERVTAERSDILVFQSEPLAEPLTICGPVSAVLHAASSALDTDWHVSLMDVDPQGQITPLCRGTIRARFRHSLSKPELLEKDQVVEYTLDLWHTGTMFQKGHRVRVEVASALFPLFSRNLNTGGHNEKETKYQKAVQRIYHSAKYPSHILLPVIPGEGKAP